MIGTVGRLAEVKRQDVLIRAFADLKTKCHDAFLLIVGDGERRPELESLATALGVADSVRFAGYQPRPEACLRLMNVFALTSRSEGMPVSILEAWAAGLPVVASRVGGVPELVEHGQNGLLFDFPDVPSLVCALETLSADRALALKLGQEGRSKVEDSFDVSNTAADYEGRYKTLATSRRASLCASSR